MLARTFPSNHWAVVLGGSSGFGLATAQKLAEHGLHCFIVHRDRRGAMPRIEAEFEHIRRQGVSLITMNVDALDPAVRAQCVSRLAEVLGPDGRVRVLLHSIAFGNLKLLRANGIPEQPAVAALAAALGVDVGRCAAAVNRLFGEGVDALGPLAEPPAYPAQSVLEEEDFERTIYSMGTSLLSWARSLLDRRLFADDARVFGLTSEGNSVAWKGYAAVAAAKAVLESVARAMAVELAPSGVRSNIIQAGVTDTPALRAIPGHDHLAAQARLRNPFHRLTTPRDVANVIFLLSTEEAAWINGAIIRVDGGEHIAGAAA
jgi:NAD(P)-dependent dehydrogenase (short-subunit alcohol dehydrogenase family)